MEENSSSICYTIYSLFIYRKWQAKKINELVERERKKDDRWWFLNYVKIHIIKKMGMKRTEELGRLAVEDGDFYFLCRHKSKTWSIFQRNPPPTHIRPASVETKAEWGILNLMGDPCLGWGNCLGRVSGGPPHLSHQGAQGGITSFSTRCNEPCLGSWWFGLDQEVQLIHWPSKQA